MMDSSNTLLWFFVLLAGFSTTLSANVTKQELPKTALGLFETVAGGEEFLGGFRITFSHMIGIHQDRDDSYHISIFWPGDTIHIPFTLGERRAVIIHGVTLEYNYTLLANKTITEDSVVLRGDFLEVERDQSYQAEIRFLETGFSFKMMRDGETATIWYRRIVPSYTLGAFEADISKCSPGVEDFLKLSFPAGLNHSNTLRFFHGREEDKYFTEIMYDPAYLYKMFFHYNEKYTYEQDNYTREYYYNILDVTPLSTTLSGKIYTKTGVLMNRAVMNRDGMNWTAKAGDRQLKCHFRRVLPWMFYGTYQEIIPKDSQDNKTSEQDGKGFPHLFPHYIMPVSVSAVTDESDAGIIQIYQEADHYMVKRIRNSSVSAKFPFELNHPGQTKLPDGRTVSYNVSVDKHHGDVVLSFRSEINGFRLDRAISYGPEGIEIEVGQDEDSTKKFRRLMQNVVFGSFVSTESNPEFINFVTSVGLKELLQDVNTEFARSEEPEVYIHKLIISNNVTKEFRFKLGDALPVSVLGHDFTCLFYYFEMDNVPTLRITYRDAGNDILRFDVTAQFDSTGYIATYSYGGAMVIGGDKIAKRRYNREGPSVPMNRFSELRV